MKVKIGLPGSQILFITLIISAEEQKLPFYCPFDYATGQLYQVGIKVWDAGGSAGQELQVTELAALQSPPGLAQATGRGVRWLPSGTARRNAMQFTPVNTGNIYVSFLIKIVCTPSSGSKLFAYLENTTSSTTSPQLGLFIDNLGRIGVAKKSTAPGVWSQPLSAGVHFVVVRYTFVPEGNDEVSLWVDPPADSIRSGTPPIPIGTISGGSDPNAISYFVLNCPSGAGPELHIDELRIGLSWGDVAPPAQSNLASTKAYLQLSQFNQRQGCLLIKNLQPGSVFRVRSSQCLNVPLEFWEAGTWQTAMQSELPLEIELNPTKPVRFFVIEFGLPSPQGDAPVIITHPQSIVVLPGQEAHFFVRAIGDQLFYQWYYNGEYLPGATNPSLTISPVQQDNTGMYWVVVWNAYGSVTSKVATLELGQPPTDGRYFVSPTGNDSNDGTVEAPFYSLAKAISLAQPGDTIYVRGGTYTYTQTIVIDHAGESNNWIRIFAYPGEKPVLNFSNQPYGPTHRGILITTNARYWHIKGLEICYAGDNGMKVEGSYLRIERCVFHHNRDTGLQIGFSHDFVNPNGELAAFIEVINCDSYMNYDPDNRGSDADGFAAKMHCGKGIVFVGCRSWKNSDDGWDLFETDASVIISNCWTWHNGDPSLYNVTGGSFQGNGNGFKLGGNGTGGNSKGTHYVYNCIAFNNNFPGRTRHGFDQNSHKDGIVMYNCLAWNNHYNYFFEDSPNAGKPMIFKNNVSFGATANATGVTTFPSGTIQENNSWNLNVLANASDYVTLTEEAAEAPRGPDGSLPSDFARLVWGSDLIDKGVNVGLPWCGSAPDLGPYEYCQ